MDTLTIQLKHKDARKLLQQLEDKNMIKLLNLSATTRNKKPSQLRGRLSKKTAQGLLLHVSKSRKEWSGSSNSK